jgi:hypothetical protein
MRHLALIVALFTSCAAPIEEVPSADHAPGGEAEPARDVRSLLESSLVSGEERCILRPTSAGFALGLPLVSAVNPRPELPSDLPDRLAREGDGLSLFTLYGRFGEGGLPLAATTRHAPPLGPLLAVFLTPDGVILAAPGRETRGPSALTSLSEMLAEIELDPSHLVAVVPSAETPMKALAWALAQIDARGAEVTLALPLPPGTQHRVAAGEPSREGMCGEHIPAPSLEGELSLASIRRTMASLPADVRACRAESSSYEAARGGTLGLLVRVGASGRVAEACMDEDTVGDPALRTCVLERARALEFEPPSPEGTLDLRVPLRIERDVSDRARGLCPEPHREGVSRRARG